jgi:hypothetical protein
MPAKYSVGRIEEISRFNVSSSAEITIQIADREGRQFIIIKEQQDDAPAHSSQQAIEIPAALLPELKRAVAALEETFRGDMEIAQQVSQQRKVFAHESEEEFARILDFYHIAWQYEPRTFPIEWDAEGNVLGSFTPDFYLTDHDLYIEMTTLKQALVTRKNRKVRLLKQLYPKINIKVLYASDLRKLVQKFAGSGAWQEQDAGSEGGNGDGSDT